MNAIVLSFERLPSSLLGCYGNGWIETPSFDRLASQGALFHQHTASQVGNNASQGWWSGRYRRRRPPATPQSHLLAQYLERNGVAPRFLVESTDGSDATLEIPSPTAEIVRGQDGLDRPPEETPFLRLIERALRSLRFLRTSRAEPWLLWIQSRGVPVPWLPPREYASKFLEIERPGEEETEEASDATLENNLESSLVELSPKEFDDLLVKYSALPDTDDGRDSLSDLDWSLTRRICGGCVALLDAGLHQLLENLQHSAENTPTLLIVTAAQGQIVHPLGNLKSGWEELAEENVRAPLLVRGPGLPQGCRRQELVQTVDLFPTLVDWYGLDASELSLEGRSLLSILREQGSPRHAWSVGEQFASIRTDDHYLIAPLAYNEQESQPRLFVKPDDVWEVHDAANQSPGLAEELSSALNEFLG